MFTDTICKVKFLQCIWEEINYVLLPQYFYRYRDSIQPSLHRYLGITALFNHYRGSVIEISPFTAVGNFLVNFCPSLISSNRKRRCNLRSLPGRPALLLLLKMKIIQCIKQCESNPLIFSDFFPKRLEIFSPNFTHLLRVPIYARLQFFYPVISNYYEVMPY